MLLQNAHQRKPLQQIRTMRGFVQGFSKIPSRSVENLVVSTPPQETAGHIIDPCLGKLHMPVGRFGRRIWIALLC